MYHFSLLRYFFLLFVFLICSSNIFSIKEKSQNVTPRTLERKLDKYTNQNLYILNTIYQNGNYQLAASQSDQMSFFEKDELLYFRYKFIEFKSYLKLRQIDKSKIIFQIFSENATLVESSNTLLQNHHSLGEINNRKKRKVLDDEKLEEFYRSFYFYHLSKREFFQAEQYFNKIADNSKAEKYRLNLLLRRNIAAQNIASFVAKEKYDLPPKRPSYSWFCNKVLEDSTNVAFSLNI